MFININYFKFNILHLLIVFVFPLACQPPTLDFDSLFLHPTVGMLKYAVFLEENENICSGFIVSSWWVMSAAHCFFNDNGRMNDANVSIKAGVVDNKQLDLPGQTKPTLQLRRSVDIIIHPDFKLYKVSKYDLALIKVNEAFNFTFAVDKVNISGEPWPWGTDRSRTCISSGFGNLRPGKRVLSRRLKMWNSTALHGKYACPCTKRFQWKRLICLEEIDGVGLCQGDVGSALVCYDGPYPFENNTSTNNRGYSSLKAYGVAHMVMDKYMCSFTRDPDMGCSKIPTISIYTYLCPINNWIGQYVPDVPPTPLSCKCSKMLCSSLVTIVVTIYLFV